MRFSRVLEIFFGYCGCMLVIAGACWLLHVHVAYLRFNNHIKDACKSRERQLLSIMNNNGSSMEIQ
jgi:hypothetical protein